MINYYELLGVNQSASDDDIRAKLKMKKRVWTQRQNAPKPEQQQEASNNLRLVPEIEATLFDAEKRSAYDKQLRTTPKEESHLDMSSIEADDLILEGWHLLGKGNVPDALMVATKATETQGQNPDAWALLGYCKSQWGEFDDAVYEYKRAIKLRPNDASFYFDLGGIYESKEQWNDAMLQYQRAEQIDPSKTVYRSAMGSVYIKNEMYQEGIDLLEKCIKEEPDNEDYKYLLAIAYTDSSWQNWTHIADGEVENVASGWYATNKSQIEEAEQLIEKAEKLNVSDQDLANYIRESKENIEKNRARKFYGNWLVTAVWTLFGLGTGGILLPIPIFYIFASRPAQYQLNRKIINGEKPTGGWEGILWVFLFYPIMALWNGYKNYLAD